MTQTVATATDRFEMPDINALPEDIRDTIVQVQKKAGFVPNVFLKLARRPDEFRAFFAYHDALMLREQSKLTKAEREMIVVATSGANACTVLSLMVPCFVFLPSMLNCLINWPPTIARPTLRPANVRCSISR